MENITLTHTFLNSPDQDAAVDFYTRVLGLEVRSDVVMEGIGMRWLTVGPSGQPEIEINLMNPDDVPVDADTIADVKRLTAAGAVGTVIFSIPDCQAAFDHVKDSGAEVTQEPTEQPYGVKDCAFRDPNGNHVRFSEVH
jgi:catechol 2,3-dioxygenase-like lactoylglutathione lyase family enzyme